MSQPSRDQADLFAEIDRSARDGAERHDSKAIYDALQRHGPAVGGQASLPADDRQLSTRILAEARTRSAEVAAVCVIDRAFRAVALRAERDEHPFSDHQGCGHAWRVTALRVL